MASSLKNAIKARTAQPNRGRAYGLSTVTAAPELPEQADALPESLQVIARNYIGARRRSGEALLEAARWLSEARAQAKHGEWQIFLEATSTSEGTANRLLDIHAEAMRSPQFVEAIMRNWLTFTAAAELAQKSMPPEIKQKMLNGPEPPSRGDVQRAKREAKSATVADLATIPPIGAKHLPPDSKQTTDASPAPAPPTLPDNAQPHWFEPTRGRFVATAELAKWCAEQFDETHDLASPDQRAAMAEAATRLVAELEELIQVLR